MVHSVLSVLLFGMVPVLGASTPMDVGPLTMVVGSPSPFTSKLGTLLSQELLSASGVAILDLDSGQTLFTRDGDTARPMASLTKLMTALVIAEHHEMDEWVEIPKNLPALEGSTVVLAPGEHFKLGDVLTALLVHSANEAGVALARFHSGSEKEFVSEMNTRAQELGLMQTSFADPVGFDYPTQHSSPKDLAWLMSYVLRSPILKERLSLSTASIRSREGTLVSLVQTHQLLNGASSVIAGKTGTTDAAGECLISVVSEGSREILVVLLASRERYRDMQTVLTILGQLLA